MANKYNAIAAYKRAIMKYIVSLPNVVQALDYPDYDPDNPEELIGKVILPYRRFVETVEEKHCYIMVRAGFPEMRLRDIKNAFVARATIQIFIVAHQDKIMMEDESLDITRIDYIDGEIINGLATMANSEDRTWLGNFALKSDLEDALDYKHICRVITLEGVDVNVAKFLSDTGDV